MLPSKVVFAANATRASGAGHVRRLVEVSKALPGTVEKYFFGKIEIPWVEMLAKDYFSPLIYIESINPDDFIIIDSYDEAFCGYVYSQFPCKKIFQLADRHTALLPNSQILFLDLPFNYNSDSVYPRTLGHGIEYLPLRNLRKGNFGFKDRAERVLVTTGGVVNETIFLKLIDELTKVDYLDIKFEFIGFPASKKVDFPNLKFHNLGSEFDYIAADCDTSISAAGTTMWDLLANQFLVGLVAVVENQESNLDFAVNSRQALELFSSKNFDLNVNSLQSLLFDQKTRRLLYDNISKGYDFNGAERVIRRIFQNTD